MGKFFGTRKLSSVARALVLAMTCLGATAGAGLADQRFDGDWSIYIFGEPGPCAFGYKLPIRIDEGNILYKSQRVSARAISISAGGTVAIRLGDGVQTVTGTGAINGQRGSGKWIAPGFRCTGSWRAVKQ